MLKGLMLILEANRAIQLQSAANTATMSSALGRQGATRSITTIRGTTIPLKDFVEIIMEDFVVPKSTDIPWWLIVDDNLSQLLSEKLVPCKYVNKEMARETDNNHLMK